MRGPPAGGARAPGWRSRGARFQGTTAKPMWPRTCGGIGVPPGGQRRLIEPANSPSHIQRTKPGQARHPAAVGQGDGGAARVRVVERGEEAGGVLADRGELLVGRRGAHGVGRPAAAERGGVGGEVRRRPGGRRVSACRTRGEAELAVVQPGLPARLRRHAGAGAGEPPARGAVAGPAGGGGEVPAGLDAGRAAGAGGEEERERRVAAACRAPALGGEVQAADGGEGRGRGQVGHHQRHLGRCAAPPRRPRGSRRACGCGRRRGGRGRGRRGGRRRSAARRTRPGCSQSTGPASRAAARSAKTARAGPVASCARARASATPGASASSEAAGAWRVWSMMFAGCSQELPATAIKLRRGCAPSARRTPRR